jgi:hypothetical protein
MGDKVVRRFLAIDKMTTGAATSGAEKPHRFGCGAGWRRTVSIRASKGLLR